MNQIFLIQLIQRCKQLTVISLPALKFINKHSCPEQKADTHDKHQYDDVDLKQRKKQNDNQIGRNIQQQINQMIP